MSKKDYANTSQAPKRISNHPLYFEDSLTTQFLKAITIAMIDQKISQAGLSKKMNKSRPYIHKILNKEINLTLKIISEFCYHLNLKPKFIFCNSQENSQKTLKEIDNLFARNHMKLSAKDREKIYKQLQEGILYE